VLLLVLILLLLNVVITIIFKEAAALVESPSVGIWYSMGFVPNQCPPTSDLWIPTQERANGLCLPTNDPNTTAILPGGSIVPGIVAAKMICSKQSPKFDKLLLFKTENCSDTPTVVLQKRAQKTCFNSVSLMDTAKLTCVREAPDCRPRNAMNEDQCNLRIGYCAFHQETRIMMKWTGPGCRGRNGKVLQDGGCQCAKYCGYKCKAACNSDPYNMCAWNATRGVCTYKDGGADGYSMAVCPPIVNRGPGAEGGFTLFGANQGA